MNAHFLKLLSHPFLERLGWTLIHSLWQISLVALLLSVVLFPLRRSEHRHAACLGAFLLALACSMVTFYSVHVAETPPVSLETSSAAASLRFAPDLASGMPTLAPQHSRMALASSLRPWLSWLAGMWALGVFLLGAKQILASLRLRRWRREHCQPASPELQGILARLCLDFGIRRTVRLLQCAHAATPLVWGWLRPIIVVPSVVITGLTAEQLQAILAHELAHLRRSDPLLLWFQNVMETLFFFHPAMHWMGRRLRVEREHRCDDLAVAKGTPRATLAAALGRLALGGDFAEPALGATGHMPVLERMRRLIQPEMAPLRGGVLPFVTLTMAGALTALSWLMLGGSQPIHADAPPAGSGAPQYVATSKLIIQWPADKANGLPDPEARADFRATQIEILESGELQRRARQRVRGLHPDLKDQPVEVRAARLRDSSVIEVSVTGGEPAWAKNFNDALTDEYLAFRTEIVEKSIGKAMNRVIEEVLSREKDVKKKAEQLTQMELAMSKAPDPESFKIKLKAARDDFERTKIDYGQWKKTMDKLETGLTATAEIVAILERPAGAQKRR